MAQHASVDQQVYNNFNTESHQDVLIILENNTDLSQASLFNQKVDKTTIKFQASIFNQAGRVYAPRYRQAHYRSFSPPHIEGKNDGIKALLLAYSDIKAAFQYYIKHENKGRPFILAGHSQGSLHLMLLMQELMTMNIQMRIITDANIDQMESMSYSNNINLLLHDDKITPSELYNSLQQTVEKYARTHPNPHLHVPPQRARSFNLSKTQREKGGTKEKGLCRVDLLAFALSSLSHLLTSWRSSRIQRRNCTTARTTMCSCTCRRTCGGTWASGSGSGYPWWARRGVFS